MDVEGSSPKASARTSSPLVRPTLHSGPCSRCQHSRLLRYRRLRIHQRDYLIITRGSNQSLQVGAQFLPGSTASLRSSGSHRLIRARAAAHRRWISARSRPLPVSPSPKRWLRGQLKFLTQQSPTGPGKLREDQIRNLIASDGIKPRTLLLFHLLSQLKTATRGLAFRPLALWS